MGGQCPRIGGLDEVVIEASGQRRRAILHLPVPGQGQQKRVLERGLLAQRKIGREYAFEPAPDLAGRLKESPA